VCQILSTALLDPDCIVSVLLLSGCELMRDGAKGGIKHLSAALRRNHSVHTLSLSNNMIDNWGARELAIAMQDNLTVVSMDLDGNVFDEEWMRSAHTLHTEVDPSLRSLMTCLMRNGELAAAPRPLKRWKVAVQQRSTDPLPAVDNDQRPQSSHPANGGSFDYSRHPTRDSCESPEASAVGGKDYGQWIAGTELVRPAARVIAASAGRADDDVARRRSRRIGSLTRSSVDGTRKRRSWKRGDRKPTACAARRST
jgi:hypothetical protein